MLRQSYMSTQHIDTVRSVTHAFGKPNAVIIADIDKNGYLDLVTFPSNYSKATHIPPVVWTNNAGKFTSDSSKISNQGNYQYFRDMVAGDFNRDGYEDYFMVDQGWELENRNSNFFYGNSPSLIKGTAKGLEWVEAKNFITARDGGKTFNHIGDAADYDGDGDLDVAIAAMLPRATNQFRLYENDGTGKFTWREGAIPTEFADLSGTTFIKLGDKYALVNGFFRQYATTDTVNTKPPVVLTYNNGKFEKAYDLARPDLGGRERNFGSSDMYNVDINRDGREDLIITWEAEPMGGINDGVSNLSGNPMEQRYKDLSNTIVTVWFQDANGKLVQDPQKSVYSVSGPTAGAPLHFTDFNRDGYMDFWAGSFGVHPSKFDSLVFLNDGTGHFANPKTPMFATKESFPSWHLMSPYFFDIDNDGDHDVVAQRPVFGQDNQQRNIGEELRIFINDSGTISTKIDTTTPVNNTPPKVVYVVGTDANDTLKGNMGDDMIYGKLGRDLLTGGDGSDIFVFDTALTATVTQRASGIAGLFGRKKTVQVDQTDSIMDFDVKQDKLIFDSRIFSKFAQDKKWQDNVAQGFANQDNDDWLVYDKGTVWYDVNGNAAGGATAVVTLVGTPVLNWDHIMVV